MTRCMEWRFDYERRQCEFYVTNFMSQMRLVGSEREEDCDQEKWAIEGSFETKFALACSFSKAT